jgi:hypothetical protein
MEGPDCEHACAALLVSPAEKLTPELRVLLSHRKEGLLELLAPQVFDSPRVTRKRLEKTVGRAQTEPEEPLWVIITRSHGPEAHEHSEQTFEA